MSLFRGLIFGLPVAIVLWIIVVMIVRALT